MAVLAWKLDYLQKAIERMEEHNNLKASKYILIRFNYTKVFFITDRVRSTRGRLCFDMCLSVCPQEGAVHRPGPRGGVPQPGPAKGVPRPGPDGGYP